MTFKTVDARIRFVAKVNKTETCWAWKGAVDRNGYGQFRFNGKTAAAHRAAYELHIGPIPDGLELDHLCRNHGCVNPKHLEAVDKRTNILRGVGPSAESARAKNCVNGHIFDHVSPSGSRECRACWRMRSAAYRLRRREAAAS